MSNRLIFVLLIFASCRGEVKDSSSSDRDVAKTTREIEFWGFSERENELFAYTIEVPKGGNDIYYGGQQNPEWGEQWERKIVTIYADGSTMFITNQYNFGGLNALLRTKMPDSSYNDPRPLKHGTFESTYWKEIRTEDIVVGYEFVPKEKIEVFEKCLKTLSESKELRKEILKKLSVKKDSIIERGA